MPDSTVTLVGNLTRDPELRFTTGGSAVCSFGLAVSKRFQRNGEWEETTSFFNCSAWGEFGENIAASAEKGSRLIVFGELEQRSWESKEGEKRTVVEVRVQAAGPDLRWAQAQIERTKRDKRDEQPSDPSPGGRAPTRKEYPDEEPF